MSASGTPPPEDLVGTLRDGRFRITQVLGVGGNGVVFGAHDMALGRPVAIKQLRGTSRDARRLLAQEARALACVAHPNVVAVYSSHLEGEPPYLAMEWFDGRALDAILAETGRMPLDRALPILRQVASALDALHAAGFVHGDVKPANVLVDHAHHVKLVDIGLGAAVGAESTPCSGTPAYMSPETSSGIYRIVGPQPDIYSFAVCCYQLVTGCLPFRERRDPFAGPPTAPPRASDVAPISRGFDVPLAWGLDVRPDRRPTTCTALADALEAARRATDAEGHALHVLVVEDDDDERRMIASAVAMGLRGAVVQAVGDGDAALASLALMPAHVVVLDLGIPGTSGAPLVRAIRELAPATSVVVLTGSGSGPELKTLRPFGVRRFLVKPAELTQLIDAVRESAHASERAIERRALG
jgi:CheY-like chemotaxis protein